jgi:hypothetical protein
VPDEVVVKGVPVTFRVAPDRRVAVDLDDLVAYLAVLREGLPLGDAHPPGAQVIRFLEAWLSQERTRAITDLDAAGSRGQEFDVADAAAMAMPIAEPPSC